MRQALSFAYGLLLVATPLEAQEVFAGLSAARVGEDSRFFYGWQAAVSAGDHSLFQAVVDLAGQYDMSFSIGTDTQTASQYQALFGLRAVVRRDQRRAFAHALGGVQHVRHRRFSWSTRSEFRSTSRPDTGPAWGFGGGVDVVLSEGLVLRVLQLDFIATRHFDHWFHDLRAGVGVVLDTAAWRNKGTTHKPELHRRESASGDLDFTGVDLTGRTVEIECTNGSHMTIRVSRMEYPYVWGVRLVGDSTKEMRIDLRTVKSYATTD